MKNIKIHFDGDGSTDKKMNWFHKLKPGAILSSPNVLFKLLPFLVSTFLTAFLMAYAGVEGGILLVVTTMAVPILYALIVFPKFGVVFLLTAAYLFFIVIRIGINFPLGTLMDGLEVLLIFGVILQQKKEQNWQIFKGHISVMIFIWIGYNLLQVINPVAESRLAWIYTIRSVATVMLTYFIFLHNIRTVTFIRILLKIWIGLSVIGAVYGLKQEFIGFSASEQAYLYSDPVIASLLFINGHWRIFSIFSDPVAFSYNMVASSLLCISLITGPLQTSKKVLLGCLAALFIFSMIYSGTRGAYLLLPMGFGLFAILKYNRKILLWTLIVIFFSVILVLMPTSNPTLYRFQSAFKPTEDASYNLRKENQKKIQPYILAHPMGGGLGATGIWGTRFAPNSFLANFPPDSGYVRVAVELGWIGLLLFCLLMFIILKTGIKNFYLIKDSELKSYCLAMVLVIFTFNIGNYPQEAIVQFPSNIFFYFAVAIISITLRLDKEKLRDISVKR